MLLIEDLWIQLVFGSLFGTEDLPMLGARLLHQLVCRLINGFMFFHVRPFQEYPILIVSDLIPKLGTPKIPICFSKS